LLPAESSLPIRRRHHGSLVELDDDRLSIRVDHVTSGQRTDRAQLDFDRVRVGFVGRPSRLRSSRRENVLHAHLRDGECSGCSISSCGCSSRSRGSSLLLLPLLLHARGTTRRRRNGSRRSLSLHLPRGRLARLLLCCTSSSLGCSCRSGRTRLARCRSSGFLGRGGGGTMLGCRLLRCFVDDSSNGLGIASRAS
ncbi:hypothetical protein PMAYCL1PPCAC_03587, partial [Pristionchus mayeri]